MKTSSRLLDEPVSSGGEGIHADIGATSGAGDRMPRVQSVDRAMLLLRAVGEASAEGATAAQVAQTCALNRATAWRILHTLETHDMVRHDAVSGRWTVGVGLVELARSAGPDALLAQGRRVLEQLSLQTGETAALAWWRSGGLTYVDEVVPPAIVTATWLGRTVPLHATSCGKVLLAFGGPDVPRPTGGQPLHRFTETTLTSTTVLDEEVAEVRRLGYGTCRGEYESSAWGVSAPVMDPVGRLAAVLSIWGPGARMTEPRLEVLGPLVRARADTFLQGLSPPSSGRG